MNAHQRTNYRNSEETGRSLSKGFTTAGRAFFRESAAIGFEMGIFPKLKRAQNDPLQFIDWAILWDALNGLILFFRKDDIPRAVRPG